MVGIAGEDENAPPSMLYCTVNPETAVTVGRVNAALHVLADAVSVGAVGKITTFTVLLDPHEPGPVEFAAVLPQADVSTYLTMIE